MSKEERYANEAERDIQFMQKHVASAGMFIEPLPVFLWLWLLKKGREIKNKMSKSDE